MPYTYGTLFRRLTKEDENATTEMLANLMQRKYIRDCLLRFLIGAIPESILTEISGKSVSTQVSVSEHGQPDLVITGPNVYIILENKVLDSTILQEHETKDYIKLVSRTDKDISKLVFLVPKNYAFKNQIGDIEKNHKDKVIVKHWEDLLSFLDGLEIESSAFMESFGYLDSFFYHANEKEYTIKEVHFLYKLEDYYNFKSFEHKTIEKFHQVRSMVLNNLNKTGENEFSFSDSCSTCGGIGEFILYRGKGSIFFGFNNPSDYLGKFKGMDSYSFSVCFYSGYTDFLKCPYLQNPDFAEIPEGKKNWICIPIFNDKPDEKRFTEMDFIDQMKTSELAKRITDIIQEAINSCKSMS